MLAAAGWIVQDFKAVDFSAGRGIALREVPLKTGPCDYLLLVDRAAVGVIEAKKEGTTLSNVAEQSGRLTRDESLRKSFHCFSNDTSSADHYGMLAKLKSSCQGTDLSCVDFFGLFSKSEIG